VHNYHETDVGLRDVTGVFSRFFVVGFFVPSFFAVLTIAWLFAEVDEARDIYIAGAGALLVALVLVGLRDAVWQAFERHPWRSPFGDATFEYHERVRKEWGLTVYWAWPFIKPFFNEYERELDVDGRSDVHFFLNAFLGAVAIAVALVVDAFSDKAIRGNWIFSVLLVPVALGAAYASYAGATSAVRPWGEFKEAAVALHRYELYKGIRVGRLPNGDDDFTILNPDGELDLATKVNDRLAPVKGINEQAPIVVRRKIEIAAAPKDVWDALMTFARWRHWDPNLESATVPGFVAERSEFRLKADMATIRSTTVGVKRPRPIAWTGNRLGVRAMRSTVERVARRRRIAWTGKRFGIKAIYFCWLTPQDGKTLVEIHASCEGLIARGFRARLKRHVECALGEGLRQLNDEASLRGFKMPVR
jgi:Polyketide cyclase / dehydrase and lipid transport